MRIISGIYRNRQLYAPPGREVRPTPEKAREALFSTLGGNLEGHTFLDLYAGAGTVGLEAVSRGAELVIFVERDRRALGALRRNTRSLQCEDRCRVIELPVDLVDKDTFARASVIFMDPPYGLQPKLPRLREFLETAPRPPLVIYQWDYGARPPRGESVPPSWIPDRIPLLNQRRYGRTMFSLYYQEVD
jgi:16S rRNA (guanine966-N2)-methyltransferase